MSKISVKLKSSVAGLTFTVLIATVIAKLLSFIETTMLANVYGASMESDAFLIAYSVPTVLFTGVGTAISTIFIPSYTKYCINGTVSSQKLVSNLVSIFGIFSVIVIILVNIFAKPIVHVFAVGFEGEKFALAVDMVHIMSLSMLPIALQYIFIGYLQLKKRFFEAAIIPSVLNLIIIIFMMTIGRNNVRILSFGMVCGYFLALILFFYAGRIEKFKYVPYCNIKEPYIKEMLELVIPVFLSAGVSQINGIIDRTYASLLEAGYVSALDYANKVNTIISTFSVTAFATVLYPILAKMADDTEQKKFCEYIEKNILFIIALVLPMTVVCMSTSEEIVFILFGRGKFTDNNVNITAQCLTAYSFGFIGYTLRLFLIRVFYSCHDSKTPSFNTIIALVFNIVFNVLLFNKLKHIGLALATALASNITTALLLYGLQKKKREFKIYHLIKDFFKLLAASLVMCAVILYIDRFIVTPVVPLTWCIKILIGFVFYICILLITKEKSMMIVMEKIKKYL